MALCEYHPTTNYSYIIYKPAIFLDESSGEILMHFSMKTWLKIFVESFKKTTRFTNRKYTISVFFLRKKSSKSFALNKTIYILSSVYILEDSVCHKLKQKTIRPCSNSKRAQVELLVAHFILFIFNFSKYIFCQKV